jgi:hypothetical protein
MSARSDLAAPARDTAAVSAPRPGTVERAAQVARGAGRRAFRAYGIATAGARPLPDFLLIGAKRGGTTTLYYTLLGHPQVLPQWPSAGLVPKRNDTKGVHYFDAHPDRSVRWYRSHFASERERRRVGAGDRVVTGEGSPYYLYHPCAAARAAHVVPDARILVLLRHPIERTFSHFREQTRNGIETLSFEDAIDAEARRTAGEEERLIADPRYHSYAHEQQSYVRQSEYARGLRRWLEHYPREQIFVGRSEDFYEDPQRVYDQIAEFLGLRSHRLADVAPWNVAPSSTMDPSTRARLEEHFAPHVAELEALTGRRFGWAPW